MPKFSPTKSWPNCVPRQAGQQMIFYFYTSIGCNKELCWDFLPSNFLKLLVDWMILLRTPRRLCQIWKALSEFLWKKQCIWGEINQELGQYQVYLSRLVFIYLYEFLFLTKFKLIMRPTKNNMSLKNVTKTSRDNVLAFDVEWA